MPVKVLLIDDNPDDRDLIARQIRQEFQDAEIVHIVTAADFEAALAADGFDAVVTDYEIRWSTGLKVLEKVKSACPDVSVLFFTGTGSEEIAVEALKAGAADYIVKSSTNYARIRFAMRNALRQHEAQDALENLRVHLHLALHAANVGTWDWNLKTNRVFFSPEWKRQIGYEDHEISNDFSEWQSRVHPDDMAAAMDKVNRFLADPWPDYFNEFRFRHKDGSYRWILTQAALIRDTAGNPTHMVGVHVDITERKRTEHERELESARHRVLFEQAPDGIVVLDAGQTVVDANKSFADMLGRTIPETVGLRPWDWDLNLAGPGEPDQPAAPLPAEPGRVETQIRARDGSVVDIEVSYTPVEWGGQTYLFNICRDISERKRAETARLEAEKRLELAVAGARLGLVEIDIPSGAMKLDPRFFHELGYAAAELPRTTTEFDDLIHPEDLERLRDLIAARRAGKVGDSTIEFRMRARNGAWHWVVSRTEIDKFDETGKPLRLVGTYLDITDLRRAEEQLLHAQRMDAVGRLTGGIAHDFNNLLGIVIGNLEMLADAIKPDDPLYRHVEATFAAAQRGADLTRRLLAFARKQSLRPEDLELNAMVRDFAPLLNRTLGQVITVETDLGDNAGWTRIDKSVLENALLNLAINARDAMPAGGTLRIATAAVDMDADDRHVVEGDLEPGPYASLTVSDTGIGMTADVRERAFEPFFTTKDVGKGSGLGLAMVYGFVKQSGGHVALQSEPGDGTTVTLYMPRIAPDGPREAKEELPAETPHRGRETILVVEDDSDIRLLVTAMLQRLGYQLLEAADGETALSVLDDNPQIELLLTDVVLTGGVSGKTVAAAARSRRPELKIVYMSGYPGHANGETLAGDDDIPLLTKPFRRDEIARVLRDSLDGRGN